VVARKFPNGFGQPVLPVQPAVVPLDRLFRPNHRPNYRWGDNLLVLQAVVGRWWPGSSRTASANRYYRCLERLYRSGLSHHRNAGLAVVPGQPPAQLPLRGDNLLVLQAVVGRWWSGCSGWLRPTGTTGCSTGCTAWAFLQWYPVFTGCTGETTGCTAQCKNGCNGSISWGL